MAQFDTAEVLGTVRDNSGAVVSRAHNRPGESGNRHSGQDHHRRRRQLHVLQCKDRRPTRSAPRPPGSPKAVAKDVTVNVNARQRVDLVLQVGAVTESVEVTGRRRGAGDRLQLAEPVDQHQGSRGAAAQRPHLFRSRAAHHRRGQVALLQRHAREGVVQRQRPAQHLQQLSCWTASTTTPTAPATRASPTRWRSLRRTPSRSSR